MNDKNLDRQADNLLDNVNDTISLLVRKIEELEQDLIELDKQHEQSLKVAFEKGFDEGVKHINQLIMSDEKFSF
jgi:cell division septum initiation protein DivIVA